MTTTDQQPPRPPGVAAEPRPPSPARLTGTGPAPLERRGRRWIFGSFALCPCHLPLTLGILVAVLGGTAAGAVVHDVVAGAVISAAWVAGTWRGFRLVRLAQHGACALPPKLPNLRPGETCPSALPTRRSGDVQSTRRRHDRAEEDAAMMWNGNWAWAWLMMVPMMVLMWALIASVFVPWVRNGRDRPPSPLERLDGRLAAGEISVDEHRTRRAELEHRS